MAFAQVLEDSGASGKRSMATGQSSCMFERMGGVQVYI